MSAAREKRPAPENIATAISGFHGIKQVRSPEAGDHLPEADTRRVTLQRVLVEIASRVQALARAQSEEAHAGPNPALVRPDPDDGGLDPDLVGLDSRQLPSAPQRSRADEARFRSDVSGGRPKDARVRRNMERSGRKMLGIASDEVGFQSAQAGVAPKEVRCGLEKARGESDAPRFPSAGGDVRLNEAHVESDARVSPSAAHGSHSDASGIQSDQVGIASKETGGRPDERGIGLKMVLFRPKQSGSGPKVCGVQSDAHGTQSVTPRFQSKASRSRASKSFFPFETAVLSNR